MPRPIATSDVTALGLAGLAMVALTCASVMLSPPAPSYARASTYSAGPDGAKAAFLTLEQLGYRVERSFEPAGTLRADPETTTLVLASPQLEPSAQDRRALQLFVERGGRVLATGRGLSLLPGMPNGATSQNSEDEGDRRTYRALAPGTLTLNTPSVQIAPEVASPGEHPPYYPVFADGDDSGVLSARIGQGRIIWWIGSAPLLNASIEAPGHVELLLSSIGPPSGRTVLWDEHYHGQARSFWSYVKATPLPAALAQLGVLAVAAAATFSRRRRPIRPIVTDTRASAMEFVDAMASLYQKAGAAGSAIDVARTRLRRLLASMAQLPSAAGDAQIVAATAVRCGLDPTTLSELLSRAAHTVDGSPSPAEALPLVQQLQEVSAAVRRAAGGRG